MFFNYKKELVLLKARLNISYQRKFFSKDTCFVRSQNCIHTFCQHRQTFIKMQKNQGISGAAVTNRLPCHIHLCRYINIRQAEKPDACFTQAFIPPFAVTYAVKKQHGLVLSHRTRLQSAPDPRGCLPQTQHLSIILISNPNVRLY